MSESVVDYRTEGPVAIITMSRPEAMNAFNQALRLDLAAALTRAGSDAEVRAVVVTGAERAFSAGADLTAGFPSDMTIEEQLQREYRPIFDAVIDMEKPVIAAINGAAAGIALSLALVCDLAVMSEKAFLLAPFSTISLVPDGGATWLLQKQLGYKRAYQLCVEAERIDAQRCLDWGLVNRVVDPAQTVTDAISWAQSLAERAPLSLRATKIAMRRAESVGWSETFDNEAALQNDLVGSPDNHEGVQAFFEKRKPVFKG